MNTATANQADTAKSDVFPDGSSLVRAKHLQWTPWAVPGFLFKLLDVDRSFDKSTLLLSAPGDAVLPAFRQSGAVEIFIELGSASFPRGLLGQADYAYLPGGSSNGPFAVTAGSQIYMIVHGPLRMGTQFIDADSMLESLAGHPAGDHIRSLLAFN